MRTLQFCHMGGAREGAHSAERRSPSLNSLCLCAAWAGQEGSALWFEGVEPCLGRLCVQQQ